MKKSTHPRREAAAMKTRLFLVLAVAVCTPVLAANFTVTTTDDAGPGSLREAILAANTNPGADQITFAIPGTNVHTITPLTALPAITNTVSIDGYSQSGSQPNTLTNGGNAILRIRLDGSSLPGITPGLKLSGTGHLIRGLVIVRCTGNGILLENCSSSTIAGNWIGLDVDNLSSGTTFEGLYITTSLGQSSGNVIGGTTPDARNIISGNRTGIFIFTSGASGNRIEGNFIGTDATGTLPRGNLFTGISIQSSLNTVIGGTSVAARNVISGNGTSGTSGGIYLLGAGGTRIQNNFIGTDVSGTLDLGNGSDGIGLQGGTTTQCQIGGAGTGNVIANNRGNGIYVFGAGTNSIQGNFIGVDTTGQRVLGNTGAGISVTSGNGNIIGGPAAGTANDIRFNGKSGIEINSGTNNPARGNALVANRGLAIDLGAPGQTTNDVAVGDADTGANGLQNYPVITSALVGGGNVQVSGYLDSAFSAMFIVDFYAARDLSLTGFPQAQAYLGSALVNTGPDGIGTFNVTLPITLPTNSVVSATATDAAQNTSELSAGLVATPVSARPTLVLESGAGAGSRVITWPSGGAEFRLETTFSLAPPVEWLPVTNGIQDNGSTKSFLIQPAPPITNQYFRLRWP